MLEVDDPTLQLTIQSALLNSPLRKSPVALDYLRRDGLIYTDQKSYLLALYEFITVCHDVGQVKDYMQLAFTRQ